MIAGGCMCGSVRYQSDAEPFHPTVCHCSDCRRAVGAAAVAWFSVPRATLRYGTTEPASYRSSARATRRFCAACGTSIAFEDDGHPDEVDITLATLDDPERLPPRDHTQAASKLGWDAICDGLPAYAVGRPGR